MDQEEVHDAVWCLGNVTHQVDREFLLPRRGPHVGERDDAAFLVADDGHGKSGEIGPVEEAQRESLFADVLSREPGVGDRLELVHHRRHSLGGNDLERETIPLELAQNITKLFP